MRSLRQMLWLGRRPTSARGTATSVPSARGEHGSLLPTFREGERWRLDQTDWLFLTHAWPTPAFFLSEDRKRWRMLPSQLTPRSWPHPVMRMTGAAEDVGATWYIFGGPRHPGHEVQPQAYRQLGRENDPSLPCPARGRRLAVTTREFKPDSPA